MTNLLKKSCITLMMVWLCVVVCFSTVVYAESSRTIKLSIIHKSLILLLARNVVQAAYDKLGYQVEFKYLPPQRALELANIGALDGETARIDGTDKIFTNLIKVPVPVSYITGVVFTRHIVRDIRSWKDLEGLKIGIIKGVQYSERGTKGMNVQYAKDNKHLMVLLEHDRIDVGIAIKEEGEHEIELDFKGTGIHQVGEPVFNAAMFHYVNKKNKHLASQLEAVLRDMEKAGTMKSLWKQAEQSW